MDDLIGVVISQGQHGRTLIVQRRSVAERTMDQLGSGVARVFLRDVVGNTVIIDNATVTSSAFVKLTHGQQLRDLLEPIPPDVVIEELVPEVLERPKGVNEAVPGNAADQDPIERLVSNWGR